MGENKPSAISKAKRERLKRKIRTVAKMQRMFKTMRQQNESVLKQPGGHKLQMGEVNPDQSESDAFKSAMMADSTNERLPEKNGKEKDKEEEKKDVKRRESKE